MFPKCLYENSREEGREGMSKKRIMCVVMACFMAAAAAGCGKEKTGETNAEEDAIVIQNIDAGSQVGNGVFTPPPGSKIDKNGNIVDPKGNTFDKDGGWQVPEGGRVDSQGHIYDKDGNLMGGGAVIGSKG